MNQISQEDLNYLQLAINLAKKNTGITGSNPSVASVLVKNNVIISTGNTCFKGIPHSENVAILKAKKKNYDISGAKLYVTLEPCCHFGKTPPCTDLIIEQKISKVFIATIDPDSRVNGGGIKKLQEAGIEVVCGIMERQAQLLNCGFFTVKKNARPFITLKLATSLDGKIFSKNDDNKWISGQQARKYAHYLRAKNDAILIGANTLRKDNPMLNCRIEGLEKYSPKRIIISSKLDLDLNSQIIQSAKQIPTYIITNNIDTGKFTDMGVNIIYLDSKSEKIDIKNLAEEVCKIGVNNLLVEGGAALASQFLQSNLVDKLVWIKAPKIIGKHGLDGVNNFDFDYCFQQNLQFTKSSFKSLGEDVMWKFYF